MRTTQPQKCCSGLCPNRGKGLPWVLGAESPVSKPVATTNRSWKIALALAAWCGFCQPAPGQGATEKAKAPITLEDDVGPSPELGPDPLAPAQVTGPAPIAPGAAAILPEAETIGEADPIVAALRQRLASMQPPHNAADREDNAALVAFYARSRDAVWTSKDALTARARQAIAEIGRADDWGLKASAFELPTLAESPASPEAIADSEIKLSVAVLKYARQARGGRLEPSAVSRKFDQRPRVYDPGSVMLAIANADDVEGYLRGLHPKHDQFARLQRALAAARGGPANDIRRIIANMERWRWMPDDLGSFYVWDSVPEQMTRVVDKGKVVLAEKIVVGRPNTPTPIFSADMQFIIFHPSWGVPSGMKVQELGPMLRNTGGGWFSSNPLASAVLSRHGLQVTRGGQPVNPDAVDWSKVDIRGFDFVQPPGPTNVLGIVKFRFPNKHDVYMHDTPERHLFGGAVRAFSHGCMRVQNPVHLAEVLLAHDKGWSASEVQGYVKRGGEIRLTTPIPVHVTYFTVVVDDEGKVQQFADIYGLDDRVTSALEGAQASSMPKGGTAANSPGEKVRTGTRIKSHPRRPKAEPSSSNPLAAIFGN